MIEIKFDNESLSRSQWSLAYDHNYREFCDLIDNYRRLNSEKKASIHFVSSKIGEYIELKPLIITEDDELRKFIEGKITAMVGIPKFLINKLNPTWLD